MRLKAKSHEKACYSDGLKALFGKANEKKSSNVIQATGASAAYGRMIAEIIKNKLNIKNISH